MNVSIPQPKAKSMPDKPSFWSLLGFLPEGRLSRAPIHRQIRMKVDMTIFWTSSVFQSFQKKQRQIIAKIPTGIAIIVSPTSFRQFQQKTRISSIAAQQCFNFTPISLIQSPNTGKNSRVDCSHFHCLYVKCNLSYCHNFIVDRFC